MFRRDTRVVLTDGGDSDSDENENSVLAAVPVESHRLKAVLSFILIAVWSTVFLGIAFEVAAPPRDFGLFTVVVFLILGQMWGFELGYRLR